MAVKGFPKLLRWYPLAARLTAKNVIAFQFWRDQFLSLFIVDVPVTLALPTEFTANPCRSKIREESMEETPTTVEVKAETIEQSSAFIGQWNKLISTTNWEKGAIIIEWRQTLKDEGASAGQYSDEAWCNMVGGVTPQHVGRLRRTSERFGETCESFEGLYWSHFYAALDWDDAEMWLEGAIQNDWSVSQMRNQRWETMGKLPAEKPRRDEIVASETEEEDSAVTMSDKLVSANEREYIEGPVPEGPDFGDEDKPSSGRKSEAVDSAEVSSLAEASEESPAQPVRLFDSFKELPDDIRAAADMFKVAIITHKASEWEEIDQQELFDLLAALGHLARTDV